MKFQYSAFLLIIALTYNLHGQNDNNRLKPFEETYRNSKTLVQSGQYLIEFELVYNSKERIQLNKNDNSLKISQTTSKGSLASISGNKSKLILDGKMENYNATFNDDAMLINVSYKINETNVKIAVKPNGIVNMIAYRNTNDNTVWIGRLRN